jgi:uncharacterized protein YjiS (DUF1127 family)
MQPAHIRHAIAATLNRFDGSPFVGGNDAGTKTHVRVEEMNLIRNYRNWRRFRETVKELSSLSNRELSDLGISRAEIEAVAWRAQ